MPYRDAIPNAVLERGESRLGARIAGAAALVIPSVFLLPISWVSGNWAFWVLVLARLVIARPAREPLSHLAAIGGVAAVLVAIAGYSHLRARRFAIEEALRRDESA